MKNLHPICWAWIVFLSAGLASADTLKVAGDPWPPFVEHTLPGQGLAMLVVTTALERAGYESEVTIAEWTHVRQGAELGIFDALAGVWYSDERNKTLAFSEPYWTNRVKLIKRADSVFSFDEILRGQLPRLVMGVVRDYAYGDALEQLRVYRRVTQNYLTQILLRLAQGDVDFALGDELALQYHIKEYFRHSQNMFQISDQTLVERGLRLAVSRAHPEHEAILEGFAKAMEEMSADGTFEEIVDQFRR